MNIRDYNLLINRGEYQRITVFQQKFGNLEVKQRINVYAFFFQHDYVADFIAKD